MSLATGSRLNGRCEDLVRRAIVFRDVSLRKEQEQRLAELNAELELKVKLRTAQLQAANAELETLSKAPNHSDVPVLVCGFVSGDPARCETSAFC